jgi:DNA-binding transcriptional MerR regulator
LARWAQRFTPEALDDVQRALLALPEPPSSKVADDLLVAALHDAEHDVPASVARGFYEDLSEEQLRWMREPSSHPDLAGRDYPLTMSEMQTLTGASARQLRHWEEIGLLPAHRVGGERRFLSAAVARAFALKESQQHEIAALAALASGGEDAARFARLIGAQVGSLAGGVSGGAGDELAGAAATIVRLSGTFAGLEATQRTKRDGAGSSRPRRRSA